MFPTADQIATAAVEACRLTGEGPMAMVGGAPRSRARLVAFAALADAFPDARKRGLALAVGFVKPDVAVGHVKQARGLQWWNEEWIDEIVGLLVAPQYGEQSA